MPQRSDHGFGVISRTWQPSGRPRSPMLFPPVAGIRGPFTAERSASWRDFLMDLGQLAQHHHWPITKNLDELLQSPPQALRGFEYDEWESGGRGTGN